MPSLADGKVKKLIPSTAPEFWKASLSSVRLQHTGNKKVYETASNTERRVAISRYEFLKKSTQTWDCGRHGPAILLVENKWFVGFEGLAC